MSSSVRTRLCSGNLFDTDNLMRCTPGNSIRVRIPDHDYIFTDRHIERIIYRVPIAVRQSNLKRNKRILKQHVSNRIEIHFLYTEIF